jgi:hypothetical protein
MFSITSYSYGRPKKTSTLLGLFIFVATFLQRSISKHSIKILSLDQNTFVCCNDSDWKHRTSMHLSFDQKWRLQ